jgi:hypothetical protein
MGLPPALPRRLVFVDETGANTSMTRTHGRAPAGERVEAAVPGHCEPVIGELDGPDGLADEGFEGVVEAVDPHPDVGLAVVGLREDVGDPDGDEPAVGEALVEGMWGEMAVEGLRQAESDQEDQQQGDGVDPFVSQLECGVHGGTPTRAARKAPLYRRRRPDRKIQA